jgi:hypothetical protein
MEVSGPEPFGLVDLAYDPSSKKYVAIVDVMGDFGTAMAFSVSDDSVTSDSPVVFKSESITSSASVSVNPDGGDLLFFYCMTSNQKGNATAGAVSGDTIQLGSEITITSSVDIVSSSYNPSAGRHVVSYRNGGTGGKGYARLVKADGIEAEADGGAVQLTGWSTSSLSTFTESVYYPKTGKTVVGMLGAADYKTYAVGLAISEDGVLTADEDRRISDKQVNAFSMVYDPSAEMLATCHASNSGTFSVIYSPGGTTIDIIETNLTQDNFIGVAKGDYADGDEAAVQIAGINADQQGMTVGKQYILPDGALTTDDGAVGGGYEIGTPQVFLNEAMYVSAFSYDPVADKFVLFYKATKPDATKTTLARLVTASGNNITFSDPIDLEFQVDSWMSVSYDPVAKRHVVAYSEGSSGLFGTSVVVEVSGDTVTAGTPVVFYSKVIQYISGVYDSVANKHVFTFQNAGNSPQTGNAVVGTVSGDTMSFGSPSVFNGSGTTWISSAYDPANNRHVVVFTNDDPAGTAVVGTVSGDDIAFGTPVTFNSGNIWYPSCTYDHVAEKVVISYQDYNVDQKGGAIVGEVSGESISFGPAVYWGGPMSSQPDSTYNPARNEHVIAYSDEGSAPDYKSYLVVGKVSGNSIGFESLQYPTTSYTRGASLAYGSVSDKLALAYQDGGNSAFGTAFVAGYEGGEPSNVFAGTAISPTELNIKDLV